MKSITKEQYILDFVQRCRYYHKKTLKPTTRITVEQTSAFGIHMHRHPRWMPIHMHICLEKVLDMTMNPRLTHSRLSIPYHIIHGLVCDYAMKDIIKFIRSLGDRRFYANTYWRSDSS